MPQNKYFYSKLEQSGLIWEWKKKWKRNKQIYQDQMPNPAAPCLVPGIHNTFIWVTKNLGISFTSVPEAEMLSGDWSQPMFRGPGLFNILGSLRVYTTFFLTWVLVCFRVKALSLKVTDGWERFISGYTSKAIDPCQGNSKQEPK